MYVSLSPCGVDVHSQQCLLYNMYGPCNCTCSRSYAVSTCHQFEWQTSAQFGHLDVSVYKPHCMLHDGNLMHSVCHAKVMSAYGVIYTATYMLILQHGMLNFLGIILLSDVASPMTHQE